MLALFAVYGCLYIDDDFHAERVAELQGTQPSDTAEPTDDTGLTDTDTDTTDTDTTFVTPDPPTVDGIDPAFGTNAGGTTVTISGGPFDPADTAIEVLFGTDVALVTSADGTSLEVTTPASVVEGAVTVSVTTSGGQDSSPEQFTYWPDATGQTGATGELVWFEYVGGIWGADEGTGYGRSTIRFTQPLEYQFYKNWAADLDTCTHLAYQVPDYEYDLEWTSIDALVGTATQTAPSATILLDWNQAEVRFTNYDLLKSEVRAGEAYDLTLTGTMGLPEVDLPAVFPVPAVFEVTSPLIDNANPPDVFADHHFEWTTDEEGDAILLQVGMLNAAGDDFEEELHCAIRDVGSFWLPSSQWTNWTPGRQVHVLLGRYNSGSGLLPWNQGRIGVASQLWQYGIGISR